MRMEANTSEQMRVSAWEIGENPLKGSPGSESQPGRHIFLSKWSPATKLEITNRLRQGV